MRQTNLLAVQEYKPMMEGLDLRIRACDQNRTNVDIYEENPTTIPWCWVPEELEEIRLATCHMLAFSLKLNRDVFVECVEERLKKLDFFNGTFKRPYQGMRKKFYSTKKMRDLYQEALENFKLGDGKNMSETELEEWLVNVKYTDGNSANRVEQEAEMEAKKRLRGTKKELKRN